MPREFRARADCIVGWSVRDRRQPAPARKSHRSATDAARRRRPADPQDDAGALDSATDTQPEGWPEEVFVQISESQCGRSVRTQRWKYAVVADGANGWNDSSAKSYREDALYDLECDPYELCNLIDFQSHRKVADVMRERLLRRMKEAGEAVPGITPPKEIKAAGQRRVTDEEARM